MEFTVMGIRHWLAKFGYLFVLIAVIAIISVAGYGIVQQQKQIELDGYSHDLAIIADLKVSQIVAWRKERLVEASSLFSNAMMSHRIAEYLKGTESTAIRKEIQTWMKELCNVAGYNNLMLFKPDGELITSDPEFASQPQHHYLDRVEMAVHKQMAVLSDLHYDDGTGNIDMDLAIPIMHMENGRKRCIAVLLIEYAPKKYLYPLIRTWPSQSFSGETLLVRREGNDVLYLSALRFKPDSALKFRVPLTRTEMPAVRAALGQEGVFEGIDYRGVRVYAATRSIPDSPWAIVTKIDTREILEPVTERIWYVVATCLIVLIALGLAVSLWWRRKREAYLRKQYETEVEFNHELKQAKQLLLEANNNLEERVAQRTEELSDVNSHLRQEIAERKHVEELLRKNFQAILQSPVAIVITDLEGTIEFVNPKFTEYSGYAYEEAVGRNVCFLRSEATLPEVRKQLLETITAGQVWEGDICNRKKSGELFWEHAKILPIKNQAGIITNFMAFKEDITKHRQLEEKLIQSRKLETIGQLASGVAHEVRNPLNAILSISEALFRETEIEENPEYEPYIQHIRTQVSRLAQLMNDLLDLGKPISAANLQFVPLLELCRETMELWKISGSAENRRGVITAVEGAASILVTADNCKLQQAIFNLLENAGSHSSAESTIILHLAETLPDSATAVVRIIDTGKGIPEESLSRVFEPFYSDRRGGTGLGLSLVKHFIENMGGSVRIWNNVPPPGCTAELHIPLAVKELT